MRYMQVTHACYMYVSCMFHVCNIYGTYVFYKYVTFKWPLLKCNAFHQTRVAPVRPLEIRTTIIQVIFTWIVFQNVPNPYFYVKLNQVFSLEAKLAKFKFKFFISLNIKTWFHDLFRILLFEMLKLIFLSFFANTNWYKRHNFFMIISKLHSFDVASFDIKRLIFFFKELCRSKSRFEEGGDFFHYAWAVILHPRPRNMHFHPLEIQYKN